MPAARPDWNPVPGKNDAGPQDAGCDSWTTLARQLDGHAREPLGCP
jgi:hypothetical protein